jgi:hypothetical protein
MTSVRPRCAVDPILPPGGGGAEMAPLFLIRGNAALSGVRATGVCEPFCPNGAACNPAGHEEAVRWRREPAPGAVVTQAWQLQPPFAIGR